MTRFLDPRRAPSDHRRSAGQILHYAIAGATLNIVLYLLYLITTRWGGEPKLVMTVLYGVCVRQTI